MKLVKLLAILRLLLLAFALAFGGLSTMQAKPQQASIVAREDDEDEDKDDDEDEDDDEDDDDEEDDD